MVIPKETRAKLYAREEVELRVEPGDLRTDAVYAIQTAAGRPAQAHFRVLKVRRDGEQDVARVQLDDDPVRLLAKVGGYTDNRKRAMDADEAEAVREGVQRELTAKARSRFEEQQRDDRDADLRKQQERSFMRQLRETMQGLRPEARAVMLARLERELRQVARAEAA